MTITLLNTTPIELCLNHFCFIILSIYEMPTVICIRRANLACSSRTTVPSMCCARTKMEVETMAEPVVLRPMDPRLVHNTITTIIIQETVRDHHRRSISSTIIPINRTIRIIHTIRRIDIWRHISCTTGDRNLSIVVM